MRLFVTILLLFPTLFESMLSSDTNWTCQLYSKPGDVSIGSIFQFQSIVNEYGICEGDISFFAVVLSEAMIYAVEDINARNDILPNTTIGYEIRNGCGTEDVSLWSSLSYFTDTCSILPHDRDTTNLVALFSVAASVTTVWMSKVANLFHIPLLSAIATSDELSDTVRFPYFFRTVPPDRLQVAVIIDILLKYNWKYIALIHSADTYGLHGGRQVKSAAEKAGICIAMSATIQPYAPQDEVEDAVDRLLKVPKAKVVVMFALGVVATSILSNIKERKIDLDLTWIGSDGWGSDSGQVAATTTGSVFIRPDIYYLPTPAFAADFASRDPDKFSGTPWYHQYWQQWKASHGCSNITQCPMYGVSGAAAMNAVYAIAHALHNFYTDVCRQGQCSFPQSIKGKILKQYLLNVSFTGTDGVFEFDQYGDTLGSYQLANLQSKDNTIGFETIGYWDARFDGPSLVLNDDKIQFVDHSNNPPFSLCREQCQPGYITIPLEEKCCYGCQACSANAIVVNQSTRCQECPLTHWPDTSYSKCEMIKASFVTFTNPIILVVLVFSSCGLIVSLITAVGLWIYRNHPLIKATSRELSAVNLLGVSIAYFDALLLLAEPSNISCPVAESMISLCFTVMFAPTLLKIVRIHRIFQAGKRSVRRPRFVSVSDQVVMVSVLITIQAVITVAFSTVQASSPALLFTTPPTKHIEIYCDLDIGFLAACIYNFLLILACCFYAMRARKVPSNYNESKFIAISVYSTLVVCLATVAVYSTAVAVLQKVASLCLALIFNASLSLACVYVPKLYAITFLDSDLNVNDWRTATNTQPNVHSINLRVPSSRVHPESHT